MILSVVIVHSLIQRSSTGLSATDACAMVAVPVMAFMCGVNTASPVSKEVQANVRFGSKADMCSAVAYVRFVPKADIARLFLLLISPNDPL